MRSLWNMLKKDKDTVSVGRFCAVIAFIMFCAVSLYLAYLVKTWGNYDSFSLACVAFVLVQLGNKAVETKMFKIKSEGEENAR